MAPRLRLVISISFILILVFLHLIFIIVFTDDDDWKKKMLDSMNLTNSILRALVPSSVFVGNNLTKNIGYFRNTVEKNLDLPLKEVENVSALNTALIDIDLSVSLVSRNLFLVTGSLISLFLFLSLLF